MPSQRDRRFFSATSLERAVLEAAGYYGVPPERLTYEKVEKRTGFTKRRKVVIRVDPENPTAASGERLESLPVEATETVASEAGAETAEAAAPELPEGEAGESAALAEAESSAVEAERGIAEEAVEEAAEEAAEEAPRDEAGWSEVPPLPVAEEPASDGIADHEAFLAPPQPSGEPESEPRLRKDAASVEATDATAARGPVAEESPAAGKRTAVAAEREAQAEVAATAVAGGEMIELPASSESLRQDAGEVAAEVGDSARARLDDLLELAGLRLEAEVFPGDEGLELELRGEDSDLVAEEEGQVIRAFEHLLPRLMQSDLGRIVPCRVDCENFQALREERLRSRAQQAAEEVRRRGQSKTLEPMHPADRRIVHLTLVPDASVTTESVGRGYFRRVSVRPA